MTTKPPNRVITDKEKGYRPSSPNKSPINNGYQPERSQGENPTSRPSPPKEE